jgi:hypothetical protein
MLCCLKGLTLTLFEKFEGFAVRCYRIQTGAPDVYRDKRETSNTRSVSNVKHQTALAFKRAASNKIYNV